MLGITLLTVGKLKERHWRDACDEYVKRLSGYCKLGVLEVEECRLPDHPSAAQIAAGTLNEGDQILSRIPAGSFIISMCLEGRELSSEALARQLEQLPLQGKSHITFIIGGSHGLSDRVKVRSHLRLSMSPMTFPHQMARVMLLEQIYRALSITAGAKYHK